MSNRKVTKQAAIDQVMTPSQLYIYICFITHMYMQYHFQFFMMFQICNLNIIRDWWPCLRTVLGTFLIGPKHHVWGDTLHGVKLLLLAEGPGDSQATPKALAGLLGVRVVHVVMADKKQEAARCGGV